MFEKIKKMYRSSVMCIKYPFLYPRNVWYNRHYTNFRLLDMTKYFYSHCYEHFFVNVYDKNDASFKTIKARQFTENEYTSELYDTTLYIIAKNTNKTKYIIDLKEKYGITNIIDLKCGDYNGTIYISIEVEDTKPLAKTVDFFNRKTNYFNLVMAKITEFIQDYPLQLFHCIPTYTLYDCFKVECPGWEKAFGQQFIDDLKEALIKDKCLKDFRITQWKEKRTMQVYCNCYGKNTEEVIRKYENLSATTCIMCGKNGSMQELSYDYEIPLCKECYEKDRHL